MKIGKKVLASLLALALIVSTVPSTFAAETGYLDVPSDHWASDVIAKWSGDGYGVLQGNDDGTFAPSRELTLGELAAILSRTFGYVERVSAEVTPAWAGEYVEKAIAAGVIDKSAAIDANVRVTREQAVKYIALAYNVAPVLGNTAFTDDAAIGAEYKPYVNAFQKLGYVEGKGNNDFDPKGGYTRAEVMAVLDNTTSEITDNSVSDKTYAKDLIVRKSGVTVADTAVSGDLIVGQGVGDGDATLDNVTVEGRLIVLGGGEHSIVNKGGSKVAALVTGKANVHIQLESGATVLAIEILDAGVSVTVSNGATVEGQGKLASVTVKSEAVGAVVTTPNTIIVNDSRDYVTTANGVVKSGETKTTTASGGADSVAVATGGSGGGGGGGNNNASVEQTIVEVATANELAKIIKDGTENVRIVVTRDMTVTSAVVGMYEPFGVYDLLLKDDTGSTLYIPDGVTLTIEEDVKTPFVKVVISESLCANRNP